MKKQPLHKTGERIQVPGGWVTKRSGVGYRVQDKTMSWGPFMTFEMACAALAGGR